MKIGNYEVSIVNAGYLAMDCGAVFGVVPKALWEKRISCDRHNRMLMATNCLLLESKDRRILVDTGVGNGLSEKLRKIYKISDDTTLVSSLAEKGVKPEDITDVVATHLHFDHAGGLMNHRTKRIFFPNATYYCSEIQYKWANQPSVIDRASYARRNFDPVPLRLLKEGEQRFDGLRFYTTRGHTPGLLALEIQDEQDPGFYCTDIFPTSHHVPVHFISAYDLYPLSLVKEKEFFLKKAEKQDGMIIFSHDVEIKAATIEKIHNHYQINKTIMKI